MVDIHTILTVYLYSGGISPVRVRPTEHEGKRDKEDKIEFITEFHADSRSEPARAQTDVYSSLDFERLVTVKEAPIIVDISFLSTVVLRRYLLPRLRSRIPQKPSNQPESSLRWRS